MLKTPLGRMHLVSLAEGTSFLLLLGVAMPLKYLAGIPEATSLAGSVHGLLFVLYLAAAVNLMVAKEWSLGWLGAAFVAAVLPFGTFWFDARLRRREREQTARHEPSTSPVQEPA